MKKEEIRELEIKLRAVEIVFWVNALLLVINMGISVYSDVCNDTNQFLTYYVPFAFFGILILIVSKKVSELLEIQIQLKKQEIEIVNIKEKAKEGDLKKILYIKETAFSNAILCKNISKIEIKHVENTSLIVDIYFDEELCIKGVKISIDALLKEVNNQTKKSVATELIDSIKLGNLEDENMKLTINAGKLKYENSEVTDKNLSEWFIW